MSSADLIAEAVAELYSAGTEEFTARRTALAARAKAAGESAAAKSIAALRKPTKSADAVNRLIRGDADALAQLTELGERLRRAQQSADPGEIRKLTSRRRALVEQLTTRAFEILTEPTPSANLRAEVSNTLKAALADESVAEQVALGRMLQPVEWDGFGFNSGPELSLITGGAPDRSKAGSTAKPQHADRAQRMDATRLHEKERARAVQDVQAAQAREAQAAQAREAQAVQAREAQAAAEEAVTLAASAVAAAQAAELAQQDRIHQLQEELEDARLELGQLQLARKRAQTAQRRAEDRLRWARY